MGRFRNAAWKEELLRLQMGRRDPRGDRVPRLLGDLELHRPLGLLLHDNRARGDMTALDHIVDAKPDQITPAQLTVDGEVEQGEFPGSLIQLQSNPNGPDSFSFSGGFWPSSLPLFHGVTRPVVFVDVSMSRSFVE
jgi:hypothetical protein